MNIKNILGIGFFLSLSIFSLYSMHESLYDKRQRLMSAIWGNNLCAVRAILNEGLNPNFYWGRNDTTPLVDAMFMNQYKIVEILLDHEANPNFAKRIGERPFFLAVFRNNIPAMKLLIQRGADWRIHYDEIMHDEWMEETITEPTKRWLKEYATPQPRGAE